MLNVAGGRSLVTGWKKDFGFLIFIFLDWTHHGGRLTARVSPGFPWSVRDMELKKSISDTERVLRSYGAVSETAWTTDKGERVPAPTHDAVGAWNELASVAGEIRAVKWLNGDSRGFGAY